MSEPVSYTVQNGIAVITINNPPVNALSCAVRTGLAGRIQQFAADTEAGIALLIGQGSTFIAGADITEFGKPLREPALPELINQIEASPKPVVAVLHGTALGGGLETALGCHYRIALSSARVGLPEVALGLLPGAGGTQRLPRLTGVEAALSVMTRGEHVPAAQALAMGMIDQISDSNDPLAAGLAYAASLLEQNASPRPVSQMPFPATDPAVFADWTARLTQTANGQIAPLACVEAVQAGTHMPFTDALANERATFRRLLESPQHKGMIHAFFAERQVGKVPGLKDVEPRALTKIGIIGGGTMGAGIAVSALLNGLTVTLIERDEASVAKALATVDKTLADSVKRGKLSQQGKQTLLEQSFKARSDYGQLATVDMVIEAVFENMEVKQDVFRTLDKICRPGAILATNTSYLDIDALAAVTSRPQDVIGLHFFSPAHIMKLLEIVVPAKTAPDTVATGFLLAKKLKKTAVRAGVCDGFIGNRILAKYREAADHMVLDGVSPYDIDRAVLAYGFPMGPYAMADLAGLDIGWATRKRKAATRAPQARVCEFADRICERGWFGQKTGRGFYIYDPETRKPARDPEIEAIIAAERAQKGIVTRRFTDQDIIDRYLAALVNEAANVLDEGIALRPLDVDVTFLYGYGFPRFRGGPMKYADMVGPDTILANVERYAQEDPVYWKPAPLLVRLVAEGKTFDDLNQHPIPPAQYQETRHGSEPHPGGKRIS